MSISYLAQLVPILLQLNRIASMNHNNGVVVLLGRERVQDILHSSANGRFNKLLEWTVANSNYVEHIELNKISQESLEYKSF